MPIRAIKDDHYKGVSELYRTSDGEVTGYYVTYRDLDGKPIKKRVDANNREDARLKLIEIKQEIDLEKKGKEMSSVPPKEIKHMKISRPENTPSSSHNNAAKTMEEYHQIISLHEGAAVVSLMDIVAFEDINIFYGYTMGIKIVEKLKSLISDTVDEMNTSGFLSRYGLDSVVYELYHLYADKLCLFIKHDINHRILDLIMKKIIDSVSSYPFHISDESHIHINLSCGTTKAEGSVSLTYAQKALNEAKKYQSEYIFYDSYSVNSSEYIVNKVYDTLIHNINDKLVTPYYQGIFESADCSVPYKYESLMRLVDDTGKVLSPITFMEKSKEYRLYTQLMYQMIDKVFDVMRNYDVALTLNLSYVDINNSELCNKLLKKIKETNVGSRLTVEIVESEQIHDIVMVNEYIFALKKNGVKIAIDDFGSGFSNFDTIVDLDIDYVKLDGSLVSRIHDEKYQIILENMVNICRNLGIKTIAEYISDERIMQMAKSIGVDYLQGFYLHQPQSWNNVLSSYPVKGGHHAE